jgi:hypothetical protein
MSYSLVMHGAKLIHVLLLCCLKNLAHVKLTTSIKIGLLVKVLLVGTYIEQLMVPDS